MVNKKERDNIYDLVFFIITNYDHCNVWEHHQDLIPFTRIM